MAFIILRYVYSIPTLFLHESWFLSNALLASIEMMIWFSSFLLLTWCVTLINLQMLNHPFVSGIKTTWSWWMILSVYFYIWFAMILLRFLHQFTKDIGLQFSFFVVSFWFWHQGNAGLLRINLEAFLPFLFFGIVWEGQA